MTDLDELGTIDPNGAQEIIPGYVIPDENWVWSGGVYAYLFSHLALLGIEAVGESQLSPPISQRVDGGLADGTSECKPSGVAATAKQLRPGRQARADRAR